MFLSNLIKQFIKPASCVLHFEKTADNFLHRNAIGSHDIYNFYMKSFADNLVCHQFVKFRT